MQRGFLLICVCLSLALVGCRAAQIASDQDRMRQALLDLYTNQLMDNLIRAKNGYPLLQMQYTNITGQITQDTNGSVGDTKTATNESTLSSFKHTFANAFAWGAGAKQSNQLAITGNPVVDHNEVYDAYMQFVTTPGWFIESCDPPPACAAHIVREKDGVFYWVPKEHAAEFLRLSLVTTVQRGQPLHVPQQFECTILDATLISSDPARKTHTILLELSDAIPNDNGLMTAAIKDKVYEMPIEYFDPQELPAPQKPLGGPKKAATEGDTAGNGRSSKQRTANAGNNEDDDYPPDYSGTVGGPTGHKPNAAAVETEGPASSIFGRPTKRLILVYAEGKGDSGDEVTTTIDASPAELRKELRNQAVKIKLDHYRPTIPTTEALLESIRNETQLIRLNQFVPQ
jgi:hypothetical protein